MLGNVSAKDRTESAADSNETIKALTLLDCEQIRHKRPENGGVKQVEDTDPNKEPATNPDLIGCGTTSHGDEKQSKHDNEKPVSERDEFSPRHPSNGRGESRIRDQHRDKRCGEHPRQSFHAAARTNAVTDWLSDVITAQNEKMEGEAEPQGTKFVRLYINDPGQKLFHMVGTPRYSARTSQCD